MTDQQDKQQDKRQRLTHSRMQSFKTCRRRHWWEYEIGIRPQTDAKALRMGTAGHNGLDALKRDDDADVVAAAGAEYVFCPDNVDAYDWSIERETVETLVAGYAWRWRAQKLQAIASEQTFCIPLLNPATNAATPVWNLAGKIDGIVKLEDDRPAVIEHKFISESLEPDGDYWRRIQLDSQISLYVYAARKLGWNVEAVLYDVVRKPTIRPTAVPILDEAGLKIVLDESGNRVMNRQGKPRQTADKNAGHILQTRRMTSDEWSDKLLEDIGERPEWYYARTEIARLDSDIDELLEELWDIQKAVRDAQLNQRWYRTVTRDSCPWCPFFPLCSSHFDAVSGEVPEGFVRLDNIHPELEETEQ